MLLDLLYGPPILVVAAIIIGLCVLGTLAGQLIVFRLVPETVRNANKEATAYMAATVGIVYAVLLAFIAVAAWEQFGKASDAVSKEASLVGNIYRDSLLMKPEQRGDIPALITEYARIVKEDEWPAMRHGQELGPHGWVVLERLAAELIHNAEDDAVSLLLVQEVFARLNELYDARRDRLGAADGALEPTVWGVVIFGGLLSMTFCWLYGCESPRFHLATTALVAAAFGLVVFLIVAFDHPFRGDIQISSAPMDLVLGNMERLKTVTR